MLKVVGSEAAQDAVHGRSLLDEIAREGARRMLVAALETEVAAYLEAHRDERDARATPWSSAMARAHPEGHGWRQHDPGERAPRERPADGPGRRAAPVHEPHPAALYMRRSPKVADVLPVLYLRGLSTGDFREALAALLGDDAAGLSATNIARLTNEWETEYRAFQKRSLADRDYVYRLGRWCAFQYPVDPRNAASGQGLWPPVGDHTQGDHEGGMHLAHETPL
jgi:putative transposase